VAIRVKLPAFCSDLYPKYEVAVRDGLDRVPIPWDDLRDSGVCIHDRGVSRWQKGPIPMPGHRGPPCGTLAGRWGVRLRDSFDFDGPHYIGCWNACIPRKTALMGLRPGFWAPMVTSALEETAHGTEAIS